MIRSLSQSRIVRILFLMGLRGSTITIKFSLTLYLAKFVDLETVGLYGLIVSCSLSFPIVIRAGLFGKIIRDLIDAEPDRIANDLFHYALWLVSIYLFLLPVVGLVYATSAVGPYSALVPLIWLIVLLEHITSDTMFLLTTMRRPIPALLIGFFQALSWCVPFITASYLITDLRHVNSLLAFWISGTFLVLIVTLFAFRHLPWTQVRRPNTAWYKKNLFESRYLLAMDSFGVIGQYADRFIIATFLNLQLAGVYTLFDQIATALYTLTMSGIVQVGYPNLISRFKGNNFQLALDSLKKLRLEAVGAYIFMGIIISILFAFVHQYLDKPMIGDFQTLLWFILVSWCVRIATQLEFISLYAMGRDLRNLVSSIVGTTCFLLFLALLLPIFGIYGVPLSILLGSCLMFTSIHLWLRKQNTLGYVESK
jgi:O-antigen/teichoic acid export membrane protein